jgi:nucleoside-diphosphate-sugar epimerase
MSDRSKVVAITGATGFVGWHASEVFRDRGWRVCAVVRPGRAKPLPVDIEAAPAALTSHDLERVFDGAAVVVHCAGVIRAPNEETFRRVNVDGTRAVIDAANRTGARLVLISSQAAGGPGTRERPRQETDPPSPVSAYGRSKLEAERLVQDQCRTAWCVLRPCAVYGPRDRGFLPLFRMANRGLFLLPTDPSMAFTLVHIHDLADAIVRASEGAEAPGETCFVGHAVPRTTDDILRTIASALDRAYRPRRVPAAVFRALAEAGEVAWKLGLQLPVDRSRFAELAASGFVCSVKRAEQRLGFTARTAFETGIRATARWYIDQRWL